MVLSPKWVTALHGTTIRKPVSVFSVGEDAPAMLRNPSRLLATGETVVPSNELLEASQELAKTHRTVMHSFPVTTRPTPSKKITGLNPTSIWIDEASNFDIQWAPVKPQVFRLAKPPSGCRRGDLWINTTSGFVNWWDGAEWVTVSKMADEQEAARLAKKADQAKAKACKEAEERAKSPEVVYAGRDDFGNF